MAASNGKAQDGGDCPGLVVGRHYFVAKNFDDKVQCGCCGAALSVGRCSCNRGNLLCDGCFARHVVKVKELKDKYKAGFAAFDRDGNGSITVDELQEVMTELGSDVTREQLQDLVAQVDEDLSGTIEFEEFLPLVAKMLGKVMRSHSELENLKTITVDGMDGVRNRLKERPVFHSDRAAIRSVVLLVVVADEIQPVLDEYRPARNHGLEEDLLGLATAYDCRVGGEEGYTLTVLQVASSSIYKRHNSGATQCSAIVSVVQKVMRPDLLVSFGTAGGITSRVNIGDALLASGCVFIDRTRTSSKIAHDWGVFGGPTLPADSMASELQLVQGLLGSQNNYNVNDLHMLLMDSLDVFAVDMEAASEAQIAHQVGMNFLAIKVVSNGIYPGDGLRMEKEYVEHKAEVSAKGLTVLRNVLQYLAGKRLGDL